MKSGQTNPPAAGLELEGDRLHRVLFHRPATKELQSAYADACAVLLPSEELSPLTALPGTNTGLEALELAARRFAPDNTLTRRVHILLYLAEATPLHFPTFIPERSRRLSAWPLLGLHLLRTVGMLLYGSLIRRRYPLE